MPTVGVIVNPHAGKDIRRMSSAAGHVSDAAKMAVVRRVVSGAIDQGADRVLLSTDRHHLGARAVEGLPGSIEFVDSPLTGSHLDTVASAERMRAQGTDVVVALGGDGTCRDVAIGWSDVPLIAISTGTNNVYPSHVEGTAAGVAAALVASGAVRVDAVSHRSKRVHVVVTDAAGEAVAHDTALVEVALVDTPFIGARAVTDPDLLRWIVACIAVPASTGLASIAGRVSPVARLDDGGVVVRLGGGARRVRVPVAPGAFRSVDVESVESLPIGASVVLPGGGVLAFDGERSLPVAADAMLSLSVERSGPRLIDVGATLTRAAHDRRFDLCVGSYIDRDSLLGKESHGN